MGQPVGGWDSVSDCLAAIKQDPLTYKAKGILEKETLLGLFSKETLLGHGIYALEPSEHVAIEEPGRFLVVGGDVFQNHPLSEGWYLGDAVADIVQGKAHGYDSSRLQLGTRVEADVHDSASVLSYGENVRLMAYDKSSVDFKTGVLELYDDAFAKADVWTAEITAHDRSHLIAHDVIFIRAKDESFVEAHDNCHIKMEDKASCVAYGQVHVQARGQNRVWMMNDNCHPTLAYGETFFSKAYESPTFLEAIHEAIQIDRPVPSLMERLNDLTVAYGPAIREDWESGEENVWLVRARYDQSSGNFQNVPKDWAKHENMYPTVYDRDRLEIQVYVSDEYSESSAMLAHLMQKRGYYLRDDDPHYDSYVAFDHWGNAKMFNETVRYEEAVLHKLRPAVELQEKNRVHEVLRRGGGSRIR